MDPITTWTLGIGGVGLALWLVSRGLEKSRAITKLVEDAMPKQIDRQAPGETSAELARKDLPAQLDPTWVLQRAEESHALFSSSPGLFEGWLLMLRDRYNTPREIEILENAEKKIRARMSLLRTSIEANVLAHTAEDEHVTQTLKVKTDRIKAEQEHQIAAGTAALSAENALLKAQLENEQLRKQLEEAKAAATAAHRPLIETREVVRSRERGEELADAQHVAALAAQKAEKAKHEAVVKGYRRSAVQGQPAADGLAAMPPLTAAERRMLLLRSEELKVQMIGKTESRARKELEELKGEFGIDSEEYRDREAYWNNALLKYKARDAVTFLGQEDQERLRNG